MSRAVASMLLFSSRAEGGLNYLQLSHWWSGRAHWLSMVPAGLWQLVLWLNFLVLVYLLHKFMFRGKTWTLPAWLRQRGEGIRHGLSAAQTAYEEAEQKLAAARQRLEKLDEELAALRQRAEEEARGEYERLRAESDAEAKRIAAFSRQEIEAAGKLARQELRQYAATLALEVAAQRIESRLTPELDAALVRAGIEQLPTAKHGHPAGEQT